jgi:hypothetical protein
MGETLGLGDPKLGEADERTTEGRESIDEGSGWRTTSDVDGTVEPWEGTDAQDGEGLGICCELPTGPEGRAEAGGPVGVGVPSESACPFYYRTSYLSPVITKGRKQRAKKQEGVKQGENLTRHTLLRGGYS